MIEQHQLSVRVERDESGPGRYRWTILRAGKVHTLSALSYATKRESEAEATKQLVKQTSSWQALRSLQA
jgi:hypothetical protein